MCKQYGQRPSTVLALTDNALAYDLDMAVSYFGTVIQTRIDDREEIKKGGQVVGYKPKYSTIGEALGLGKPKQSMIQSTEDAIAAGFILTPPMKKKGAA